MKEGGGKARRLDLTGLRWRVQGWRPFGWRLEEQIGGVFMPDVPPVPARLPGSVQDALLRAGLLPDWRRGLRSLECEWVEHRHWEFFTELKAVARPGSPVVLEAECLDYSGWIVVDGKIVATFRGALAEHRIDLTAALSDGKPHRLALVFDLPPEEQGQAGFTSQSRFFKPRYNFSWDWCPRFVPIGVGGGLALRVGELPVSVVAVRTSVADDLRSGTVRMRVEAAQATRTARVVVRLFRGRRLMAENACPLRPGGMREIALVVPKVELWWPNGEGAQPLYRLEVGVADGEGTVPLHRADVGFKRVEWKPCRGAPIGALPWICVVNGRPVFLRGVNWVPPQVDYLSAPDADYARLVGLYREMGCNTLRVWGGGMQEREEFYRLCDRAGLLVWQEFPLSSSGIDNWPPEDGAAISELERIARGYIRRRGHHACKLLWCGGNELQSSGPGSKTGIGVPAGPDHPCLAALARVVEEEDPGVRFLPTSASGPRFLGEEERFGRGEHHDVHGPWNLAGAWDDWVRYWRNDDALFRSEVGMPGAASPAFLARYADGHSLWPIGTTNRFWLHTSSWWIQEARFGGETAGLSAPAALRRYASLSRRLQARALAEAARRSRDRFPGCGGFLLWMGHDAFPCASSTAVINYDRQTGPAYAALRRVFRGLRSLSP